LAGQVTDRTIQVKGKIQMVVKRGVDNPQGEKKDYPGGEPSGPAGVYFSGKGWKHRERSFEKLV
jgi:hypothetical protein